MEKKSKIINLKSFIESRSKTKVICTIGPSTYEVSSIIKLIKCGMSIARLNLSHGNEKDHITYIKNIREASEKTGIIIGILAEEHIEDSTLGETGYYIIKEQFERTRK